MQPTNPHFSPKAGNPKKDSLPTPIAHAFSASSNNVSNSRQLFPARRETLVAPVHPTPFL